MTFMSVLVIKDSHFHHVPDNAVASASTDGYGQTVQGACFICDFTLHKAGVVTMADFHPIALFHHRHAIYFHFADCLPPY